tara:strand:- start:4727 stop:5494 length:768 start_codon:yes stop_codon:yes gene_type:complete
MNHYSYLNQIFYIPKKFDHEWSAFDEYTLNHSNVDKVFTNVEKETLAPIEAKRSTIEPMQKDSLFWCIYILFHGYAEYEHIHNKHKNIEMDEKQKIMLFCQNNGPSIKEHAKANELKLSQVRLKEIQSELLLDKKTSNYVFYVMAFYYKLNIIIQNDTTYMYFPCNQTTRETFLIQYRNHKNEVHIQCLKEDEKSHIFDTCLLIPFDKEKPLKGVSTYKIPDLEKLALKLKVDVSNKKKNEMYEIILLRITDLQN